jgi:hypothetical protein
MANMSFEDYLKGRSKYERQKSREKLLEDYKKFKERQKVLEQKQMAKSGKMINMPNLTRDGFEMKQKFRKEKLRRLKNKAGAAAGMVTGAAVSVGMRNKDKIKKKISDVGNMKVKDAAKAIGRGIVALTPVGLGREAGKLITSKKQDPGQTRRPPKEDVQRVRERLKKEKGRSLRRIGVPTMLTGGQAKLDKNKNNKIDAQDFKILRAEKAKGRGMGLQDEKMKPGKMMKADKGGMGEAKKYKKYLKGLKEVTGKKSDFLQRRMTLGGGRLAVPLMLGVGLLKVGKKLKDKIKSKKKMGGGMMMQRPMRFTKGSKGAVKPTGRVLEALKADEKKNKPKGSKPGKMGGGMMMRRPMMASEGRFTSKDVQAAKDALKIKKAKPGDRGYEMIRRAYETLKSKKKMGGGLMEATQRLKAQGKMGGGMMKRKPMMANKGKLATVEGKKKAASLLDRARKFGNRGKGVIKEIMYGKKDPKGSSKYMGSFMGGGMMQRPMMAMGGGMMPGYKKGKSVMAKGCKLGRKKPTKMYT